MKSNLSNKNKSKKTKGSGVKNSQFFPLSKSGTGKDFELLLFPLKEISVSPPCLHLPWFVSAAFLLNP